MTSFQSKLHWDCFLPHIHKITWNGYCSEETDYLHLHSASLMQTVNSSETLLPRPHVILTYTTLCLSTTVKNWSKKHSGWLIQKKTELEVPHYVLNQHWCRLLHFAPNLCYSSHCLVKWNNKVKGYNKTKSCKPFWNAKCYQFYIYRWTYSQHNYTRYMQLPKQKWKKYHNYISHWTWQILTVTAFHSTHMFINLLVNKLYFEL